METSTSQKNWSDHKIVFGLSVFEKHRLTTDHRKAESREGVREGRKRENVADAKMLDPFCHHLSLFTTGNSWDIQDSIPCRHSD